MFIDDEDMLVELGKMMLEKLGYQPITFSSPSEALQFLEKNIESIDVVMTDLTMPGMLGTQLAEKIKKLRKDIPIILITGFSGITATKQINSSFIDALLSKPLSINAMALTIQKFIKKNKSK